MHFLELRIAGRAADGSAEGRASGDAKPISPADLSAEFLAHDQPFRSTTSALSRDSRIYKEVPRARV